MNDILILLLVLLFVAFLLRIDFVYYIVYVVAGIYLWSNWYSPRSLKMIHIERSFTKRAFIGETIKVAMKLRNESRLPAIWIQLYESIPPELRDGPGVKQVITIGGKKTRILEYRVRASKRGYYRLGRLIMSAGDFFGLKENSAYLDPDYLTIYPRILPVTTLGVPSKMPFGTMPAKQRIYEDPTQPIGTRLYFPSDSMRHINWKVSAHQNQLLVKTYRPSVSLESMIVLNLNKEDYSRRFKTDGPEWSIVIAASLAAHLVKNRQSVGLATNGVDPLLQREDSAKENLPFDEESGRLGLVLRSAQLIGGEAESLEDNQTLTQAHRLTPEPIYPDPGKIHFLKSLELLARIESIPAPPISHWIHRVCLNLSWGVSILVITPVGDDRTCRALSRLLRSGYNPVLIITEPYLNFSEIKQRARNYGFPAYHLSGKRALQS